MNKLLPLCTLVCLFLSGLCLAAGGETDAIESLYYSLSDLSAKFTQETKLELIGRTVTKSGTFQFKKGGKLRINYDGKDGKNYVSDGTTLWIFIPGDLGSLQTFAVNDKSVPKEALSFMGGFGRLKKEFNVTASAAFKTVPPEWTALHLVPRAKAKHYESLDALFGADHLLTELIVTNTSGNVSHYKFNETKTNSNLTDRLFTLSSGKATPDTLSR